MPDSDVSLNLAPAAARLEDHTGKSLPIHGSCSIGRAPSNHVALSDDRASRRHALIQLQNENEFWLVDFGSRNGTYLNDHRITRPTQLRDGDRIKIGHAVFTFRQSKSPANAPATLVSDRTVHDIRGAQAWLLVADIIGSSALVKVMQGAELATLTGQWVAACKQTIETHGGRINQFFGDGFFAYWRDRDGIEKEIATALNALKNLQEKGQPRFRLVVHFGDIVLGGVSVGEEERISGSDVHYVFRCEDLASKVGETRLLSNPASHKLAGWLETRPIGQHSLASFDGEFPFHAF